jgi:hypothetical protein
MDHPISSVYLDQQVARASAVLPGAGAFDAAPVALFCSGFVSAMLFLEYTRAGAGGRVRMRVEGSPDVTGDTWYQISLYNPGAPVANADSVSPFQREFLEYGSTAAGIEKTAIPVTLYGGFQRIRVVCAESGAVGTPGTVKVTAHFSMHGLG